MRRLGVKLAAWVLAVNAVGGCSRQSRGMVEAGSAPSGGTGWHAITSRAIGAHLEVPNETCGFADEPELGLAISLDAERRRFDDQHCRAELMFERLSAAQFEAKLQRRNNNDARDLAYVDWSRTRHADLGRM